MDTMLFIYIYIYTLMYIEFDVLLINIIKILILKKKNIIQDNKEKIKW